MFKWYGILGIILIILVELNFYFKIQPFANYYYPLIWLGFILLLDAIIYQIRKNSLIYNKTKKFFIILVISAIVWWTFEIINLKLGNWTYNNQIQNLDIFARRIIYRSMCFSTVIPAIIEIYDLLTSIHLFDHLKLKKHYRITKRFLTIMITLGILSLILTMTLSKYFFPLTWIAFFLILDPINYINKQPSIIMHLRDRRLTIPITLFIAGLVAGFFWEFWNYWALNKWFYDVPFFGFFKVFEMPILGYLGYGPFAWELYAMYFFIKSLFTKKEEKLLFLKNF